MTRGALLRIWTLAAAACGVACQPTHAAPTTSAADGSGRSTAQDDAGASPAASSEASLALAPPPPGDAPPRDRACRELHEDAQFCHENRRDWSRVLLRWTPSPHATPTDAPSPEQRLLLSHWLQRGVQNQASSSLAWEVPSAPVCEGAWLCFWLEPEELEARLEATLDVLARPPVGEFYLARLDAAAAWEAASLGPNDPRARSAALLLGSPRGRRFAKKDSLSVQDLSYSVGAAWIRRIELAAASSQLNALLGDGELELTGPLDGALRSTAERRVAAWSAERTAPPTAVTPATTGISGLPRIVLIEDDAARNGRLVLTLPRTGAGEPPRERWKAVLASLEIPATVRTVAPVFPRGEQLTQEFLGARSELEAIVAQLPAPIDADSSGAGPTGSGADGAVRWLGVLWAPPEVDPDSPEASPDAP